MQTWKYAEYYTTKLKNFVLLLKLIQIKITLLLGFHSWLNYHEFSKMLHFGANNVYSYENMRMKWVTEQAIDNKKTLLKSKIPKFYALMKAGETFDSQIPDEILPEAIERLLCDRESSKYYAHKSQPKFLSGTLEPAEKD